MKEKTSEGTDWSLGTWKGARKEELRRWRKLSLREKLDAVDELNALGDSLIEARRARGLPYVDAVSGARVTKGRVAEESARGGKSD